MANLAGNFGDTTVLSSSGVVYGAPCAVIGFLPSASGTISLFDNATTNSGTNRFHTTAVTAGQFVVIAAQFTLGCYCVIAGGAAGTFTFIPMA